MSGVGTMTIIPLNIAWGGRCDTPTRPGGRRYQRTPVGTIAPPVVKKKGEQRKKKEKETGGENFKKGKKRKIKRKKLNIDQERGCYTVGADGRY